MQRLTDTDTDTPSVSNGPQKFHGGLTPLSRPTSRTKKFELETDRNHFFQFRPKPKLPQATCTETETEAESVIFGRCFQECIIYAIVVVAFRQVTS